MTCDDIDPVIQMITTAQLLQNKNLKGENTKADKNDFTFS